MSLDIKIQGADSFFALRIQQEKLDQSIRGSIRAMSVQFRAEVVNAITRPKGGRMYGASKAAIYRRRRVQTTLFGGQQAMVRRLVRVKTKAKAYTASARGEPPATRTGTLLRSVRTKIPVRGKGYSAYIFAARGTAFYRHFLEFGAGASSKGRRGHTGYRAPRPLWSPLQGKVEAELSTRVLDAVEAFVQGR